MRLDEAVNLFCDGKAVEHDGGIMSWIDSGGRMDVLCQGTHIQVKRREGNTHPGVPIDGWRLKRETLNPMEAWSRMKAGKVVRSEKEGKDFCYRGDGIYVRLNLTGPTCWELARQWTKAFMDATDLYEVEDETNDNR